MREIRYLHESGSLPESLQNVPFLHSLDNPIVDKLLSEAILLECNPGDTIIFEGDDTRFFCILLKGAMDIMKDGKLISKLTHSGEIVGELALINEAARTASVVASKHSFCLKIEPQFLEELNNTEHDGFYARLYRFVSKLLGERLEESSTKIAKLEQKLRTLRGGSDTAEAEPDVYRL